jgi:hypothetical protein
MSAWASLTWSQATLALCALGAFACGLSALIVGSRRDRRHRSIHRAYRACATPHHSAKRNGVEAVTNASSRSL